MRLPDARISLFVAGLAALAALPLAAGYAGWRWEIAEIAGWVAMLACLALAGAAVRPRHAQPATALTLATHERLAWCALGAAVLHVGAALLAEPLVLDYLKPTLPRYQLGGLLALVLLATLVVTSLDRVRRRLWQSHRGFQASHVVMSTALLLLLALHVVATDRYTHGAVRRTGFLLVTALALLLPLRRARSSPQAHHPQRSRSVFGRHAVLIAAVLAGATLLLAGFAPTPWVRGWREPLLLRTQRLPFDFDHAKHAAVNCLTCHHNYNDRTGQDSCVHCHRTARADLKAGAEATFHEFCLGCHRAPPADLLHHGPVSGCATCHRDPVAKSTLTD